MGGYRAVKRGSKLIRGHAIKPEQAVEERVEIGKHKVEYNDKT